MTTQEDQELNTILEQIGAGDSGASYGWPTPPGKDGTYQFFREILKLEDPSRVGNLSGEELTQIRHYLNIAAYADVEGLDTVADYIRKRGFRIASTSMSKKGFLAELFVTNIRKEKKIQSTPVITRRGFLGLGRRTEGDSHEST